ncbi:MAG: hypothetical protein VKP57_04885 [Candidatus Sericytochromatia bacterium]|nr:hypothetical protein [Candidatus Sericytochromatia bacterium]
MRPRSRTGLTALLAVAVLGMAAHAAPEVVVVAPVLGWVGALATTLAWRARRQDNATWATALAARWLGLGGLLAAAVAGAVPPSDVPRGCLAALGWALGLAMGTWRASQVRATPGYHLFRLVRDRQAVPQGRCPVPGCREQALACVRPECTRTLCGTHWIMAEARCAGCGHDGLATTPIPARREPDWTWVPVLLGLGACGILLLMQSGHRGT